MMRIALYGLTGTIASTIGFVAGMYLTFPSDAALAFLRYQVDTSSNHEYAIDASRIGPWWAMGLSMDDLTLYTVKKTRKHGDTPAGYERTPMVHFDSLGVRAAPMSFLTGKQGYAFAADLLGGDMDGLYAFSADLINLSFDLSDLDLSKLGATGSDATFNLLGALGGEADLKINLKEIKQSTGTLQLHIDGFGIGEGSKMSGFELPGAKFTTAKLGFEVRDGKMTVTDGTFEGDVISATITGDVTLNKRFARSRNKLDIGFSLPEEFQKLADISPTLKRSKDEEGRYHCSVLGTIASPTFRCGKGPSPRAGRGDGMVHDMGDGPLAGPGGSGGDNAELTDEERRKRREDRIKERRERLRMRREQGGGGPQPMGNPDRPMPFDPQEDDGGPPGLDQRFRDPPDDGPQDDPLDQLPDPGDLQQGDEP